MNKSMQIVVSLLIACCANQCAALAVNNEDLDSDLLAANRLPKNSEYVQGVLKLARGGSRKDYQKQADNGGEEVSNVWQQVSRGDLAALIKEVDQKAHASYEKHNLVAASDRLYNGLDCAAMFGRSLSWGNGHLEGVELRQAKPLVWLDSFAYMNTDMAGSPSDESFSFKAGQYIAAVNNYAYYLQLQGKHSEAIPIFEKIIELEPDRTVAYLNLADSLWAVGDKTKASLQYGDYLSRAQKDHFKAIPDRIEQRRIANAN
jgi:tetratricopeptide (TPR) repeat protein